VIPSVSSEADSELSREALFYAREGGAELGAEFINEFERALTLLCEQPGLGAHWRNGRRRFPLRRFPYYTRGTSCGWSRLLIIARSHGTGLVENDSTACYETEAQPCNRTDRPTAALRLLLAGGSSPALGH
jgi:plasmid stabilization system protein ParE